LGIVILSNNDNYNYNLAIQIASKYFPEPLISKEEGNTGELKLESRKSKEKIELDSNQLMNYVGQFLLEDGRNIGFKVKNGTLIRIMEGVPDNELIAQSKSKFYYKNRDFLELEFLANEYGEFDSFNLIIHGAVNQQGKKLITEPASELVKYTGSYQHEKLHISIGIFLENNELFVDHFKYGASVLLFSEIKGQFIGSDFWINRLEFIRNEQNEIVALKLLNPPFDRFNGVRLNKQ
jgi:hypothetical protein